MPVRLLGLLAAIALLGIAPQPKITPTVLIECVYYRYKDVVVQFPAMTLNGYHVAAIEGMVRVEKPQFVKDNSVLGTCDTIYDGERWPNTLTMQQVMQLHWHSPR